MTTLYADDGAKIYFKAILFNVCVQVLAVIAVACVTLAGGLSKTGDSVLTWILNGMLQLSFVTAIITTTIPKKRALPIGFKRVDALTITLSVLCAIASVFFLSYLAQWPAILLEYIGFNSSVVSLETTVDIVFAFIVAGVCAPVVEELVFRGAFLGASLKKLSPVKAILLSGICFSLMHMNPAQTVYQFCVGVIAGVLAYYSGSIIPSIVYHLSSNLVVLLIGLIPTSEAESSVSPSIALLVVTVLMVVIGSAIIFGLIMAVRAINKKRGGKVMLEKFVREQPSEMENRSLFGKRSFMVYTLFGIGISVFMWIIVLFTSLS